MLISCSAPTSYTYQATPYQGELSETVLANTKLGLSFPPLVDSQAREFTRTQLKALDVSLIRSAENWYHREPQRGEYRWNALDDRMRFFEEQSLEVLLTIQSNGPDWACDSELRNERACVFSDREAFSTYIDQMLDRVLPVVEKIQFGNEWASEYWYPGSAQDFVTANNIVYDAVKARDPQKPFVLGGFASGTLYALAFCQGYLDHFQQSWDEDMITDRSVCESQEAQDGFERITDVLENAKYDMIDLHFYDNPEDWPAMLETVQDTFPRQVPLIVSEFGGPNLVWTGPVTEEEQAHMLASYITTLDAMGITEAYYFKLVQGGDGVMEGHEESGLFRLQGNTIIQKPAFDIFEAFSTFH